MDKMTMALEYALEMLKHGYTTSYIVLNAWKPADEMQAEADKRSITGTPEAILKASSSSELDWQPDWSQAPDYCHFFCVAFNGGYGFFTDIYPELMGDYFYVGCGGLMIEDHGYIGNWQDSLRERP